MPLIKIIKKVLFAMHRKPKIPIGSFALIVLSLSLLPLIACNTAIGRAIGGDGDGGSIEMPSPPEASVTYSVSGELNEPAPDEDEWTFEGPAGAIVELRMVTSPGSPGVDTYLVLNGPTGEQVTMNDDYEGLHAGINTALPSEGRYTIIAKGYGQSVGLYDLTVKFRTLDGSIDAESDGGPITEAAPGTVSSSYGEIGIMNDEDVWEIPALTGDNLLIILDGITQLDPTLTLLDPDGSQVAYNDDFVGRDSQITYEAQSDGVYLAVARGYGGRSVGDYYLNVTGNSERAIFNDITENLEQAQADLQAVNEVAAAAVVAELVDEAVQTQQQAAVELQEADEAADIAEEAERTSAQADVELNNAEQAEAQAEEAVQELADESSQLDQMVVQDISQLEEVSSEADLAAEANRIAEEEAAAAEAELERLRQEQAESERIAAAAEARAEAEREQAAAAAAAEAARLEEARTLERIQRNAAEAARVEAEAVAARVELAAREEAAAQAELAALAARLAEQQAEQELAEQAREAAEAEVAAAVAAEAARNAAGDSAMATIIQGGYVDVSTPQFGTASVVDGQIYYIHDGSSNPVDTFTATVRGTGGELFEVRMSVELSYVRPNTAPVAVDDIYSIQMTMATAQREAERRYEGPFDPVGNDMDGDGDSLVLTHLNGRAVSPGDFIELDGYDGSLSVSVCDSNCGTGLTGLMILPKHNYTYTGQDAFTYTVSDGNGLSSVGTVYVNLTTTYEPPVAVDQNMPVLQGGNSGFNLRIPDNHTGIRIESVGQGARGTVEIIDGNSFVYTHSGDDSNTDSFFYSLVDDFGARVSATVNVEVEISNRAPNPMSFTPVVPEGGSVTIAVIPTGPDWDPHLIDHEGDTLRPTPDGSGFYSDPNATQPSQGSYVYEPILGETGSPIGYNLIYTHDGSETAWDTFHYELVQFDGQTGWGRVDVTVEPVNDVPYASDYSMSVLQGESIEINIVDSEVDSDGPMLTVGMEADPSQGDVTLVETPTGTTITYTHNGNNTQNDFFSYTLSDGIGHSVFGSVTLNVASATFNTSAQALPAAGQTKVAWDPEIGIRLSSADRLEVRNLHEAFDLFECADSLCEDSQLSPVGGRTVNLTEPDSQILSFVPDVPLYGGTTYKVSVNIDSGIELADGNIQSLSGLISDVTSWTFTTAEMTRFTLPLLVSYSDSECYGTQQNPHHPEIPHRAGERECLTLEDIDKLMYGNIEDTPSHYLTEISGGKFVSSPVRDRAGNVVKSVRIDRDKPYIGGSCGRAWETESIKAFSVCPDYDDDTSLYDEMDLIFDRFRYRNLTHKDGSYNLLAPYRPSREALMDRYDMGGVSDMTFNSHVHYFRNVTPIYLWATGGPNTSQYSIIGMALPPSGSYQPSVDLSHEERFDTWVHELGHAYFGMTDTYVTSRPSGPNKTGTFDVMGDARGLAPFTAWNMVISEFEEPEGLFADSDLLAYLADGSNATWADPDGNNNGTLYSLENSSEFNVIKVPAIIERDTQEVKGHYLLELYGSSGYDSNRSVTADTLDFSDQPDSFPGGIAIWKWDKTEQKVRTDVCEEYFGDRVPHCGLDFLTSNGNHPHPIEYYPSIPSVTYGNDVSDTVHSSPGIYTLFPWWYSEQLPYGADYEAQLGNMPTTIELPVLEIAPFDEDQNFGGGNKVATVTLSFDQFVSDIKSSIREDSGQANNGSFNAYTPGSSAGFTYSVQKHDTPVYMTYRDHVREGQTQFASGVMWDEMQAYGFYRYTDPNSLSNPEPASR